MTANHEQWVESLGLPIHKGYYIKDLKKVEMGWWEERGCNAAFIPLTGFEEVGVEVRVTGIPPGKTTLPWKFALDDVFYVLEGKGLTTVWGAEQGARKTFEWQKGSLFMIPRQSFCQLTNAQGDKPARLVSYNHFPFALRAIGDPEFFFNNPYVSGLEGVLEDLYSEAKAHSEEIRPGLKYVWYGNFLPDMTVWDKLEAFRYRGAGGRTVFFIFPNSWLYGHMSVYPPQTYKKAHYHSPVPILVPAGEGYSVLWEKGTEPGKEGIIVPWHEGSLFSAQMYHQHFNPSSVPARYIALQTSIGPRRERTPQEYVANQIEYSDEDPWIRQNFEKELAKRGLTSLMPEDTYKERDYQWKYAEDKE